MELRIPTLEQLRTVYDRDLLEAEYFSCHPCINTSSLRLTTRDVLEVLIPALGHTPQYVTLDYPQE